MNFRTTFILSILILAVAGYLFLTSGGKSSSEVQQTNPQHLVDFSSGDVNKVTLSPAGGTEIVLQRSTLTTAGPTIAPAQSDWKLTAPIETYADAMKVSDLLDAITTADSTAQVAIGSNAADYGLDQPQETIDLEAGPKSAKLDIGRQEKAGNELYVRVEGKDVAQVVSADLLDKLDTTAEKLRLPRLVSADMSTANWVSIQRPTDPLDLEKAAGNWQIDLPGTHPTTLPAEQSVVSDLISTINNAQAVTFGDSGQTAALVIGQPQATVTISDKRPGPSTQPSTQTETIQFGSPDSLVGKNVWVQVTSPGILATVPKETMDSILKSSLDLRDRAVLKIDPGSIVKLRIVKATAATTQPIALPARTHEVVLVRRPPAKIEVKAGPPLPNSRPTTMTITAQPTSKWLVTGSLVPADADDAKVDTAVSNFGPLRVDKFTSAPPTTVATATYFITITLDSGKEVSLLLSDPGENSSDSPSGTYNGAFFQIPRSVIVALDADFPIHK